MTDRELGLRLAESFPNFKLEADAWEAVASRARELLGHEAVSVKLDYPQLDRIEKKLDWLYTNRTLTFSNQKWPA